MVRGTLALTVALLALAGCRSSGRSDLVEAELRTKERQLRELQGELEHTRVVNEALERELIHGRVPHHPGSPGGVPVIPAGVKDIILGRGTGGVDDDRLPGDDALQVVLTPRDEDASPVKAVGALRVEVLEVTPAGTKAPLCAWDVPAVHLRRTWKAGLFSTGFHVVLPWKRPPTCERLRVITQLALPDGRVFEADRDISVRPPAGLPIPGAPLPPIEPPPGNVLPAPQPEGPSLSRLRPAELGTPRPAQPDPRR